MMTKYFSKQPLPVENTQKKYSIKRDNNPMKKQKLDAFEAQIEQDIEVGSLQPVTDQKSDVQRYRGYFKEAQKKNKRINIRISQTDLEKIQRKAIKIGIPYQTLVSSVLHQFAHSE